MLQIDDKLISLDVLEQAFVCDPGKCHGACCVIGDSGAPLEHNEVKILHSEYRIIKSFLRPEGRRAIRILGTSVVDSDGDDVTPLIEDKECAYVVFDNGIARCGIEMAFLAGKTKFRKPVSCHLYPIRLHRYPTFTAVNYHQAPFCSPARVLGANLDVKVFRFLKEAITRKFGEVFYEDIEHSFQHLQSQSE